MVPLADQITPSLATDLMSKALDLAKHAEFLGEVPVGAVVWYQGKIIGRGYNQIEKLGLVTKHAELIALEEAAINLNQGWRLRGAVLVVNIEPCLMCTGAILHSGISSVIFGARQPVEGALRSLPLSTNLPSKKLRIIEGVMRKESSLLMTNFFKGLRQQKAP